MPRPRSLAATAGALCAALAGPATAAVPVEPTADTTRYVALVVVGSSATEISQDGADRFASLPRLGQGPLPRLVRSRGLETTRDEGGGAVVRRTFPAAPDGYAGLDLVERSLQPLLARAREGAVTLRPARVARAATLRGAIRLAPNDCAALRGGVRTMDLDPATLLPVRVIDRRAGTPATTLRLRVVRTGAALPAAAFRPLRPRGAVRRAGPGFRRASPGSAAARLPYAPLLPASVPAGFRLAGSGWAPRSGITGPEGSIPARPSLFQAVYARGWERLELTMRRSGGRGWPADPFAGECARVTERTVTVRGVSATFGIGPETRPHLFWREGGVLLTLSGPFPADTLVAVADSLAPVDPAR